MTDDELAGWARNWHWNDCAEDKPVDPSIYYRDLRMLKAFLAAHTALRTPQAGGMSGREEIARALFARRYRMNPKDVDGLFKWYADNTHGIDKTRMAIHSTFLDADAILALAQPSQEGRK